MNGPVLRLLDANANRAREALRVLEDYVRFLLDDASLSAAIKGVRHGLREAIGDLLPQAILFRDTPGDVGTGNKTALEFERTDVVDVVIAAGKRLGEALRSIEEYLKTIAPTRAAKVEQLRYSFYDIERRLFLTLRPLSRMANVRLYVLITASCCRGDWLQAAEHALIGGADCLQLREKSLGSHELLCRARQLVELCHRHNKLCIMNDRPDIAILSDADGVHIGQEDLPAIEVRRLIGHSRIIGVSTHRLEQARSAVSDGADYIGVGPLFQSTTKPHDSVAGLQYARQVAEKIQLPAIGISGIDASNVDQVLATGLRAMAVTAAILNAADPRAAAAELKHKLAGAMDTENR